MKSITCTPKKKTLRFVSILLNLHTKTLFLINKDDVNNLRFVSILLNLHTKTFLINKDNVHQQRRMIDIGSVCCQLNCHNDYRGKEQLFSEL